MRFRQGNLRKSGTVLLMAAAIGVGLVASRSVAQTAPVELGTQVESATAVSTERLDQLQKRAAKNADLSESDKTQILTLIQEAQADLAVVTKLLEAARQFDVAAAQLDAEQLELQNKPATPEEPTDAGRERTITEWDSDRVATQQTILKLEQALQQPTVDLAARIARRKAARTLLAELPTTLEDLNQALAAEGIKGEAVLLSEARTFALQARHRVIDARLGAAQKELALYDAADARELPTLRREHFTRELNIAQKRLDALTQQVNRQRQAEAKRRAREAELAAMNAQPLLKTILEESQQIARTEQELRRRHEEDRRLLQQADEQLEELRENFERAEKLDTDVGLERMGVWLRKQRNDLDDLAALCKTLSARISALNDAEFAFYERKDQLDDLDDIEAAAQTLTVEAMAVDADQFREEALRALRGQQVNLQKLVDEYSGYTETLTSLVRLEKTLRREADQFRGFLDARILWVRSHQPLTIASGRQAGGTLKRIVASETWIALLRSFGGDAASHPLLYIGVGLLILFLMVRRYQHGRQIAGIARKANSRGTVSIGPTMRCLNLTLRLAVTWPGLLLFVAWRLHESSTSTPPMQIVATNVGRLAGLFLLLEFVRQSIRRDGLAEAHFGWPTKTLPRIRRLLRTLMLFGLPIGAAIACLHQQDPSGRRDVLERFLFLTAMFLLALFAHSLLHPKRGALRQLAALQAGGWLDRLGSVWYGLGVASPLVLAGFAITGYYETAVRLAVNMQRTAWLVIAGLFAHALLLRWLMLRHRRLRIEQSREHRAARESGRKTSESVVPQLEADSDSADLQEASQQSQRLVRTTLTVACVAGLWLIWIDVLPAIRFLDRWPIWETQVAVVETIIDPVTGIERNLAGVQTQAITVSNLVQAIVIFVLTVTAARNLPGLLEIALLNRLPIDRSTAYAITSLTRYGLLLLGIILTSQALGISWAKVQWLAAALTFGLGFGLQEIFANFVSGIIILFEQPVRVGDVVTIDGVSGVVNRIRIRATTIVDWDRKEYIVPNREFITGRLLNWTLSDKTNRVVLKVGVAYDSDTARVRETIMQVLAEQENILDDPAPLVTLESFGDSALDFVVRAYLPNLDHRLQTIHELHVMIHNRLTAAGIEIPFPQRDLHLRTSVPIPSSPSRGA